VLYGTTREFLEHFGLRDLEDLPPFEPPAGGPGEGTAGSEAGAATGTVEGDAGDGALAPETGPAGAGEEREHPSPA
jgi:hypothetical protein